MELPSRECQKGVRRLNSGIFMAARKDSDNSVCDNFVACLNGTGYQAYLLSNDARYFLPQNITIPSHNPNSYEESTRLGFCAPLESHVIILRRSAVVIVKKKKCQSKFNDGGVCLS